MHSIMDLAEFVKDMRLPRPEAARICSRARARLESADRFPKSEVSAIFVSHPYLIPEFESAMAASRYQELTHRARNYAAWLRYRHKRPARK